MLKVIKKYTFLVISIFSFILCITFIALFFKYQKYYNSVDLIGTSNFTKQMEKKINSFLDEEDIINQGKAFVLKELNLNDFSTFPKDWQNNLNSKKILPIMEVLSRILQKTKLQISFKNKIFLLTKKNIKNNIKKKLIIFITFSIIFLLIFMLFLIIFLNKKILN